MKPAALRRSALTLALTAALAGCATNPFIFSRHLNTYPAPDRLLANGDKPKAAEKLAGGLDLALMALMDQRDMLWTAASDTETMKNLTALGLIGVGAVGLYKGLDSELHQTWLRKAGLASAAVYAGATWLEPSARQKIYLAGAMSLTCLALSSAPYEMPEKDFEAERENIATARGELERVFALLRQIGSPPKGSPQAAMIRGAWRKALFAEKWLNAADQTLGNIEKVGPRLRDLTALTASEVGRQVSLVSRDLSQVPDAIKALKPNANALIGTEIFPPPSTAAATPPTPGAPADDDDDPAATPSCEAQPKPPASADNTEGKADEAKKKSTDTGKPAATAADKAAAEKAAADKAAAEKAKAEADRQKAAATLEAIQPLMMRLTAALDTMSRPLGQAVSLVRRIQAVREGQTLPEACAAKAVTLVPSERSLVLKPGASFQYLLTGDEGRPAVQVMTVVPQVEVLDIAIPAAQAATAIRFTAGSKVDKQLDTIVRISDSRQTQQFDISVRICASAPAAPAAAAK